MEDLDAVLPQGIVRVLGPAPAPPLTFEEDYVLPEHSEKPLQVLHRHSLDDSLIFYEKPHVYTVHGVPTSQSVTGLAHAFERPFIASQAIASMKTSRSQAWPRIEYVVDPSPIAEAIDIPWVEGRGALLVSGGKTVSVVHPHNLPQGATTMQMRKLLHVSRLRGANDDYPVELYSYERELTDDEIMTAWSRKGMIASHAGTEGHWLCECFLNGLPVRWWEPELQILYDFVRNHMLPRGIVAWNTEKEIVCTDADVAGSIDLIVYEASAKVFHIVDFKRSDKLASQMRGYGKMLNEFKHLDDCKGAAYAIQTGIYQWILEREYNMRIGDRILLSIHPDRPFATSVPYLREEVNFIMRRRLALVRARRAVREENPDAFTCCLTGAPVVDAVRLQYPGDLEPRFAMEKAALVRELPYTIAADMRAAFEAAVTARLECVNMSTEETVPWRKRMPEVGLPPFA